MVAGRQYQPSPAPALGKYMHIFYKIQKAHIYRFCKLQKDKMDKLTHAVNIYRYMYRYKDKECFQWIF